MNYQEVERAWSKGQAEPVYVFYGEEDFLRSELLHRAIERFLPDEGARSFNLDQLYGGDVQLADILSVAQSYPVMAERRVVIVRDAEKVLKPAKESTPKARKTKTATVDALPAYLSNPNRDCLLIFDMAKMGPRNQSPFKELAAKAACVECAPLKEAQVLSWLRARSESMGASLTDGAGRLMISNLGTSLRVHANELEKLHMFVAGAKQITEREVEKAVGISRELNPFELQNAIGAGNRADAVRIALGILNTKSVPMQVLMTILGRYLELVTIARELLSRGESERAIADALDLKGGAAYFAKEYIAAARKYTRARLDRAMKMLVEWEERSRRVKLDDKLLLEAIVLDLLPEPQAAISAAR